MKDINDLYCSNCGAPLTKSLISSLKKEKGLFARIAGKDFNYPKQKEQKSTTRI